MALLKHPLRFPYASHDDPQFIYLSHTIHGAAIYGNMDPIHIPALC